MKPITLLAVLCLAFAIVARAQDKAAPEPPELQALRQAYLQSIERANAPLRAAYLRSLDALKAQFARAAKLDGALAVESEIKKMNAAGAAAAAQSQNKKALPITIISANYGDPGTKNVTDVTKFIRQAYGSGQATIRLDERAGRSGKDPAVGAHKFTTIEYSIDGEVKSKTFSEGKMLDFSKDLD